MNIENPRHLTTAEETELVRRIAATAGMEVSREAHSLDIFVPGNGDSTLREQSLKHPFYGTWNEHGLLTRVEQFGDSDPEVAGQFKWILGLSLEELELNLTARGV